MQLSFVIIGRTCVMYVSIGSSSKLMEFYYVHYFSIKSKYSSKKLKLDFIIIYSFYIL